MKRGRHHNELTRFRYDVVLSLNRQAGEHDHGECWRWHDQSALGAVETHLRTAGASSFRVEGVPNRRVLPELELLSRCDEDDPRTCGEVRADVEEHRAEMMEPEDFYLLGERHGSAVVVSWSASSGAGYFDVLFDRGRHTAVRGRCQPEMIQAPIADFDWRRYTNDPLARKREIKLKRSLRQDLERHLPSYMMPSDFIVLDSLPLTPNGKVDRRALPRPDAKHRNFQVRSVAPRTELERVLVDIWSDVLGRRDVGIHDNFFDLGGHSLMLMQAIARLEDKLGVRVEVQMFADQSVSQLAVLCEKRLTERAELSGTSSSLR